MPRPLRIEYPGAIYHVMSRGDRREPIFKDNEDRRCFIQTLEQVCAKTDWQVHAYCLMLNHFHLVVETPNANLVLGMRWFLSTYTARFNRRHKLFGHVFSGRYKSLVVDGSGSGYLRTVCDYVHLNPVRANLLRPDQRVSDYPWSSWPAYLQEPKYRPRWLRFDRLLGELYIPQDSESGRHELEEHLERRRAQEQGEEFKAIRRGWFLGKESFRRELLEQMDKKLGESHYASTRIETVEEKGRRILEEELARIGWTTTDLLSRAKGDPEKIRIAQRLREETSVTLKWVAEQLCMGTWTHVANRLYHSQQGSRDDQ